MNSNTALTLDEPFTSNGPDSSGTLSFSSVVNTPTGEEFVEAGECEHPTREMSLEVIKRLLAETCMHQHRTVPAMPAAIHQAR